MKAPLKLTLATFAVTFAINAQAHPGHDHHSATANVVHALDGVVTADQDKVAKTEEQQQTTAEKVKHAEKQKTEKKAQK